MCDCLPFVRNSRNQRQPGLSEKTSCVVKVSNVDDVSVKVAVGVAGLLDDDVAVAVDVDKPSRIKVDEDVACRVNVDIHS